MQYAGLFSVVTARSDGARLWRDVLARKPEKPCKYCEFATFHYSFWSVFSPLLRRMNHVSTAGWDRKKGRLLGSNHGSFYNVPELCLRIEKSAPRRIMRSAPKYREIGCQETAGFGKIAGCLINQGFMACRYLPEIRIWERNFPRNVFGHVTHELGNGFGNSPISEVR